MVFDTSDMNARERAIWSRFQAARTKGAPIFDPPRVESTKQMVREDTPWYITAAFIKIFQTGAGDFGPMRKRAKSGVCPCLCMLGSNMFCEVGTAVLCATPDSSTLR